jgi:dolichyl-phosphate-mannose--protein O-mannosyl transferase
MFAFISLSYILSFVLQSFGYEKLRNQKKKIVVIELITVVFYVATSVCFWDLGFWPQWL